MKITFWGVRGSIAVAGTAFSRTGGHTTCLEIESGGARLIIDAGTGIRGLGDKLARSPRVRATLLFTHLHWDHIQGFPFFAPAYAPDAELDLHGPIDDDGVSTLEQALARQMQPPTFPIGLDVMRSSKRFHTVTDGAELELDGFHVRVRALNHPQGALGYRIERDGFSMCFATDTEHHEDGSIDERLLDLARDVDLLIHDAQYTEAEYQERRGWGHSTYVAAAKTARAAGAMRLLLTHHDPSHNDEAVLAIEREARRIFPLSRAARETQPIAL